MIAADLSRMIVLLSLPAAYWLHLLSLGQLCVIAILAGTAHVLFSAIQIRRLKTPAVEPEPTTE